MILLLFFLALISPFIVAPVEIVFPYPHLVEELVKALLIFMLVRSSKTKHKIIGALLIGFFFAFSETVLYMLKLTPMSLNTIYLRLVLTIPMHMLTSLIIVLSVLKNKRFVYGGLLLAILIHYLFNIAVARLS